MSSRRRSGDFLGRYTFFVLLAVAITVGGQMRASRNAQSLHETKPMQACVENTQVQGRLIEVGQPAGCMESLQTSSLRVAIAPAPLGESHRVVKPSVAL